MSRPVCTVTNTSNIINATVSESHSASCATATIEAETSSVSIGDLIYVTMGDLDTSTGTVFMGYVKQIDRTTPESLVTITANDSLIRAIEYFIAPLNPDAPYTRSRVQAEDLVEDLLAMAGLTNYSAQTSYFMLAATGSLEIKLTSVYDYCKSVADLLTWQIWCDRNGTINFKNRKPFVMTGTSGQVGDIADVADSPYIYSANVLSISKNTNEKDLRNRIVVYGSNSYAEASASSPYLPVGFYKTAIVGAQLMLDTNAGCQQTADYNLQLYNRLTNTITCDVAGISNQHALQARNSTRLYVNDLLSSVADASHWYIYSCEHSFSSAGYRTSLDLRT